MVAPYFSNLLTGLISVTLNYAATFYLPSTKLLKDPLETLATAIPILLVGHIVLLVFSLLVMKRCSLRQTLISLGYALLFTVVSSAVLHGFIVLFGASLLDKFNHTLAFATYLAILTVVPCFTVLAPAEPAIWSKVFLQHSPNTATEIFAYSQAICTLSGAWIGAIVLPLDWERDWQVWPISCIISTYLGNAVGVIAAFGWSSFKSILGKRKSE
ncbi:hypothetical protein VTP01DRAFT_1702 [Rhizomucor pusillus]|uniref:uncharacterized protein n=1 Tax=Rhizomucor pusillus TaxID=4840 RepID=UPI003743BB5A